MKVLEDFVSGNGPGENEIKQVNCKDDLGLGSTLQPFLNCIVIKSQVRVVGCSRRLRL